MYVFPDVWGSSEVQSFIEYRIYHNFSIPGKFGISHPIDGDNQMTLRTVASRYEISYRVCSQISR